VKLPKGVKATGAAVEKWWAAVEEGATEEGEGKPAAGAAAGTGPGIEVETGPGAAALPGQGENVGRVGAGKGILKPEGEKVSEGEKEGAEGVVGGVAEALGRGEALDNPALTEMANRAFGGTRGEGKYNPRDAYDAMEAGVNRHIEESGVVDFARPAETVERLVALTGRLPRQADRTTEQIEFQQFSTPPAEAFVAAAAAKIRPGETMLEPSAGTGNLATMGRIAGAKVVTNEISERRASLLKGRGFAVHSVDARFLHSTLPADVRPDVVVMNPPFSATGGKVQAHNTEVGAEHVEQALLRLKPGGRLVAIVGRGMAHDRPKMAGWWRKIEQKYNVRANVGIDGKSYGKYGTGFDNQIVVIDKTGPTPGANAKERIAGIVKGEGLMPEQALSVLMGLDRPESAKTVEVNNGPGESGTGTAEGVVSGAGAEGAGEAGAGAVADIRAGKRKAAKTGAGSVAGSDGTNVGDVGAGGERGGKRGGVGESGGAGEPSGTGGASIEGGGVGIVGGGTAAAGAGRGGVDAGSGADTGLNEPGLSMETGPAGAVEEEGAVFSKYRVQKARVRGAQGHGANIVESSAMASVEPPDVKYTPDIPEAVVKEGRLSDLQLESVIYAGQRHEQMLPDGQTRGGFWMGDGTGVGKGREIAGVILDNWRKGRKRAVWISLSHQLGGDAKRDLTDVGVPADVLMHRDTKLGEALPENDGVLFTTYSLIRFGWGGTKGRFKQALEWMGKDFDGVIAFDEGHQMKNAMVSEPGGQVSDKEGTDTGAMGLAIQKEFPKARVIYASATAATEPRNMAYMSRLGLWGAGAPFAAFTGFLEAMRDGGVGAMEMLARDLKGTGVYVSRTLSYEGVDVEKLEHPLTEKEREQYNVVADFWAELQTAFEEAVQTANTPRRGRSGAFSQFYSGQQRFFLQLMMSYQLPDVLTRADKDLADGRSVVISLFSTNEAAMKDKVQEAQAQGVSMDDIDMTPREMLAGLINRHFPVDQYEDVQDPDTGQIEKTPVLDEAGNPVMNRENMEKRDRMLDRLSTLSIPDNPLDKLVNHFGADAVAEISGRKKRMVKGKWVNRGIKGVPNKELNKHETALFQEGKKRVAVITGAASTGISLHSDKRAKNRERRVFYALQLSWSADQQIQSNGRVHRSNQANAPLMVLPTTDLAGQLRLVNTTARRLASMGALSRGGRETMGGGMFEADDITDQYGEAALSATWRDLMHGNVEGVGKWRATAKRMGVLDESGNIKDAFTDDVEKFLNRIMVLRVAEQNALFGHFFEKRQKIVAAAKENGLFDLGVEKVKAQDVKLVADDVVYTEPGSGAKTRLVELEGGFKVKRLTWAEAKKETSLSMTDGVWVNLRSGKVYGAHESYDGEQVALVNVRGERHTEKLQGLKVEELLGGTADEPGRFKKLEGREAQKEWNAQLAEVPEVERNPVTLLTGAIFPIYDKIKGLSRMKVVEVTAEEGKRYLGISVQGNEVAGLKLRLGIGSDLAGLGGKAIYDLVMDRAVIELDNGWMLKRSLVHGEARLEIAVGSDWGGNLEPELKGDGAFIETIDWKKRYFVPIDVSAGPAVLDRILKKHKAIRDVTGGVGGVGRGSASAPPPTPGTGGGAGTEDGRRKTGRGGAAEVGEALPPAGRSGASVRDRGGKKALEDDNEHVRFELPELVELVRQMKIGKAPRVKETLRLRRGAAVGAFYPDMLDPRIELKASLFETVPADVRAELQKQAEEEAGGDAGAARKRMRELMREARKEWVEPIEAEKVLAHEIGHARDWLEDRDMARGNVLGRIASLSKYMKGWLEAVPGSGAEMTTRDRERIRRRAERIVGDVKATAKIRAKYEELLKKEGEDRGVIFRADVVKELKGLSRWWQPFEPIEGDSYTEYRWKPEELYADAVSVILNNPKAAEKRAPKFWGAFWAWAEAKPEVRKIWDELETQIRLGTDRTNLRRRVREGFLAGLRKRAEVAGDSMTAREIVDTLREVFWMRHGVTYSMVARGKKAGAVVDPENNPVNAVEEAVYSGAEVELYRKDMNARVLRPLSDAGLSVDDFGEYVQYVFARDAGEGKAVSLGVSPKAAIECLEDMKTSMGPDKMGALEEARQAFWDVRKNLVVDELEKGGMHGKELLDFIADNPAYATQSLVKRIERSYGGAIGGAIHKRVGTTDEVENPVVATMLKDAALLRGLRRNQAKREQVRWLEQNAVPGLQVRPARWVWQHSRREPMAPRDRGRSLLVWLENGKLEARDVPAAVASPWESTGADRTIEIVGKIVKWLTLAPVQRALVVDYSPGFWLMDVQRNFRHIARLPGSNRVAMLLKYWRKGIAPAWRRVFGDELTGPERAALKANALIADDMDLLATTRDERELIDWLEQHGAMVEGAPEGVGRSMTVLKRLGWGVRNIRQFGRFMATIPTMGAWMWLEEAQKGMGPRERAHVVRWQGGNPAFLMSRSRWSPITNNLLVFLDAAKAGWKAERDLYESSPASWWWKMASGVLLGKILRWALRAGIVGGSVMVLGRFGEDDKDEVKSATTRELFAAIPDYDLANFRCYPIGMTPKGKVVYLRLPVDEQERLVGGIMHYALRMSEKEAMDGMAGLLKYGGSQVPGWAPGVDIAAQAWDVLTGGRGYDSWRGQPLLSEDEQAGGWQRKLERVGKEGLNAIGVGSIWKVQGETGKDVMTDLERVLGVPVVNTTLARFIKVSDRGISDALREAKLKVRGEKADERLEAKDMAVRFVDEEGAKSLATILGRVANGTMEKLSPEEQKVLAKKWQYVDKAMQERVAGIYGGALVKELETARDNDERVAVLQKWRELKKAE
jgi:hypothetical protein